MLCDGDSKAFSHLTENPPYPGKKLERAECINHAPKRAGKAFRELTKDKSKKHLKLGGKGYGKLTEKKMKRLQQYYRSAIVNNKENISDMKNAIWASLYHCSSTDASPKHSKCPKGVDSWCFYNRAKALKEKPGSHKDSLKYPILPHIAKELEPIYKRISEPALLKRLSAGATTNSNECLHSVIWRNCPKHLFFSRASVHAGAARGVADFNKGAQTLSDMMAEHGLEVTDKTTSYTTKVDKKRIRGAHKASQEKAQRKRLFQKRINEKVAAAQNKAEGNPYEAGAY